MTIAAWNGMNGLQDADEAWTSSVGPYTSSSPVRENPNDSSDLQCCHHHPTTLIYEPNAKRRRLMAEPDDHVHGNNSMVLCDNMEVSTNHHRFGDITHHQQHDGRHVQEQDTCPTNEELYLLLVQTGATSYSDVVNFCVSHGVPLSRMLRLDLLRQFSASS